ncbi:type II toxin-antitoxin system RelE/ParE family toxin [Maribellus sediminis]|uniref:type II toxin-antitoxin system RelE family toxin n=1 Tax=Maribellus sediminis TaxID=2696285 RepID=UPI00142FCB90
MQIEITNKFRKQLDKVNDRKIRSKLYHVIKHIEEANQLSEIQHLKKLKGHQSYYRIRMGDYRIGISIEKQKVIFAAFDHRSAIYNYFP